MTGDSMAARDGSVTSCVRASRGTNPANKRASNAGD